MTTTFRGNGRDAEDSAEAGLSAAQAERAARVRIDRKDHYFGTYGSPESREAYDDIIAEWFARQDTSRITLTVDDLALLFLDHAKEYYCHRDGTPTRTAENIRFALRPLISMHGRTRVRDFGPCSLKKLRDAMIAAGHSRTYINGMATGPFLAGPREVSKHYIQGKVGSSGHSH